MAASAIVSAEIEAGLNVWMAAANGREAALVLRKVRRLSMQSIIADHRLPTNRKKGTANNMFASSSSAGRQTRGRAPMSSRKSAFHRMSVNVFIMV
jgi:hypothetical protein